MARKRMIDPSIWTDEGMAELTPRQQLLYIALFSNADDDGRLKASPAAIALMLPTIYSTRDRGEIVEDVESVLSTMHQLVKYDIDGREYLAFKNYRQWQRIEKPTASILPPPPDNHPSTPRNLAETRSDSDTTPRPVVEGSANGGGEVAPNRREEKGREGNSGADAPDAPPKAKTKRGTTVPEDFTLSDGIKTWGAKKGYSVEQMEGQIEPFINNHTARGTVYKDWDAAFRGWMDRAKSWGQLDQKPGGGMRVMGGGFDPLRKLPDDEKADYLRRLDEAKRREDAMWRNAG